MSEFNKGAWLEKTSEYMAYIEQHKKNVVAAWGELKAALRDITLIQRPEILNEMEWRVHDHDSSKYTEEEFLAYRQHFYPVEGETIDKTAFDEAWKIHYTRNDHHWQHWITDDGRFLTDYDINRKLCAYLEMICDWQAMGYAMGDSAPSYYRAHKDEIKIDPNWKPFVEEILDSLETYMNRGKNV